MAKGLEDTAFYRYHRLTSLNEVGGAPGPVRDCRQRVPSPEPRASGPVARRALDHVDP